MGTGRRCRVLVTGGAGSTGRRLVTALPEPGADVTRGAGNFIAAPTNAVTGDAGREVITERHTTGPLTPCGAIKVAAEMLISAYSASYGIVGCSLRFSNIYGPGMAERDGVVRRLTRAAQDSHGVRVSGGGTQTRDLVHAGDLSGEVEGKAAK